jgi:glutamyl-Q tRNA(Asp) synthetase
MVGWCTPAPAVTGLAAGRSGTRLANARADCEIAFDDRVQGTQRQNLARAVGDFVLLRADGQFAYQLAVVVDDAAQGITESSAAPTCWTRRRARSGCSSASAARPRYAHLPVVTNAAGEKLSKQTRAGHRRRRGQPAAGGGA